MTSGRSSKQSIIEGSQAQFTATYDGRFHTEGYRRYAELAVNNAYIALFALYTRDLSAFEELYNLLGRDMRALVESFHELPGSPLSPQEHLRARIDAHTGTVLE